VVGKRSTSLTAYNTHGKKDIHLHPTGTGAFKLARWEQNNIIVLEKNPDYFEKGLPYLDRLALAPTAEEFSQLGYELQQYMYENMIYMSATSLPSLQAARDYVQGYVYERGFKVRFETTWLKK